MIEIRSLKEHELDTWFDHCVSVFKKEDSSGPSRDYFAGHWYNDPWKDLSTIFVAVEKEKVLSTLRIFHREVYLQRNKIKIGGIGEVCTKPEAQGKQLASKLLNHAIEIMKERDIKISLLFASLHDFYRKFGWQLLPETVNISRIEDFCLDEKEADKYNNFSVHRVTKGDVESIKELYDHFAKENSGLIVRNSQYWELWVDIENQNCYVLKDEYLKTVAYIILKEDEENPNIIVKEYCCRKELQPQTQLFSLLINKALYLLEKQISFVKYPSYIEVKIPIEMVEEKKSKMLQIIAPFKIGDYEVESLKQLMDFFESTKNCNGFMYFSIDKF